MAAVTRTLAVEWARYGISLVNFEPGYIETGLNAEFVADPENRAALERMTDPSAPVRTVVDPREA